MPTFTYKAIRFKQKEHSTQHLLLFEAPAAEIQAWAGVPRKTFDYQHGFQRTLNTTRIREISDYFLEDNETIIPTAVVIAFNEDMAGVSLNDVGDGQFWELTIEVPNFETVPTGTLISQAIQLIRSRLPSETVDTISKNLDAAVTVAVEQEAEMGESDDNGEREEISDAEDVIMASESLLDDFFAELLVFESNPTLITQENKLRQVLYALLKPAIIVDGQHRVFGAALADETIRLGACALLEGNWLENVYQFVVINQKARPIKPAFLSAIIATSLTDSEISALFGRLEVSSIDVEKSRLMNRINTDATSPFRLMIDFEVEGAPGFLQFPGMSKLIRDFQSIPKTHSVLLPGTSFFDSLDDLLAHFYALWWGVRSYFEGKDPRLWQQPSEGNPNNLLKIVSLQETQRLMLDNWADSRIFKFGTPDQTKAAALAFWTDFPPTFFSDEWKQKGLQTTVGRQIVRAAMTETRRNIGRPNWGHRRLGLFQG